MATQHKEQETASPATAPPATAPPATVPACNGSKYSLQLAPVTGLSMERRLQTLAVLWNLIVLGSAPVLTLLLFLIAWWGRWSLFVGYILWWCWDVYYVKVQRRGGRRSNWLRNSRLVELQRDYFPVELVKTADLDRENNYLFGLHPHGIISIGAITCFGSDATGFPKLFPGITPYLLTLKVNFMWPIARAYFLYLGGCDVSKESISWILGSNGTGNAAIVVVGGAEEALEAHPGSYKLCLRKRKGFVKMALLHGSCLVPCFVFGENELYNQVKNPEGSKLRKIQTFLKKWTGISPPLFHGRGIFQYNLGILPFRRPLHTVVGEPITVPKCESPTMEQLNEYHQLYITRLTELFENHKVKYGIPEDRHLEFI